MTVKLIAVDIDGTLLNNNREVTKEVFEAIQQAKKAGVKIVLATGRPLPGVTPLLKELNLLEKGDYAIVYNGGMVQETSTRKELIRLGLTYDDYLEIDLLARKLNIHLHTITTERIYTANRDISKYTIHEASLVNMPLSYRTQEEMGADLDIIKMMFIDHPDFLEETIQKIPLAFREKYTIVKSTPFYLEILNKKASKGSALLALAETLGIKQEETMAIGDEENDISMLEVAGISVAMGNATQAVKKICDVQTATNEEHGVARAIETYVLNK